MRKEGEKYSYAEKYPEKSGVWKTQTESELTPIRDGLGFVVSQRKDRRTSITYNDTLKRFELTKQRDKPHPAVIRMPLARVSPHPAIAAMPEFTSIGIPSWH